MTFDPERVCETLARHGVDYVLVGGLAAVVHGSELRTDDIDVAPNGSTANLERLAAALRELHAGLRTAGGRVMIQLDAAFLRSAAVHTLQTDAGDLDVLLQPAGLLTFADVRDGAEVVELWGLDVTVASLDVLIRSKRAAGRPKDLAALPSLERLRDRTARHDEA